MHLGEIVDKYSSLKDESCHNIPPVTTQIKTQTHEAIE